MSVRAIRGDMLDAIPRIVAEGVVCDACVCDPPYHLTATVKRFGKDGSAPAKFGKDGAMSRLSTGFMSQVWDGGDIAFRPETWAAVSSIMRHGAFLVAFGGTRTHHRMACAIEDAGFVIQDCVMWLYATGFPKRRDMLKPSYEPILLAYKPGGKRMMQVDECRIGTESTIRPNGPIGYHAGGSGGTGGSNSGRWPANICHDGSDEVVRLFPESCPSSSAPRFNGDFKSVSKGIERAHVTFGHNDTGGSAARFFFSSKAGAEDRWGSRHPTVKPVALMKWLVQLVTPPGGLVLDPFAGSGTTGVAALAAGRNAILIEREDNWFADIQERLAFYEGGGTHSTQAKNRSRTIDHGPLFAEAAE